MFSREGHIQSESARSGFRSILPNPKLAGSAFLLFAECGANFLSETKTPTLSDQQISDFGHEEDMLHFLLVLIIVLIIPFFWYILKVQIAESKNISKPKWFHYLPEIVSTGCLLFFVGFFMYHAGVDMMKFEAHSDALVGHVTTDTIRLNPWLYFFLMIFVFKALALCGLEPTKERCADSAAAALCVATCLAYSQVASVWADVAGEGNEDEANERYYNAQ